MKALVIAKVNHIIPPLSLYLGLSWENVGETKINDEDEVKESSTGRFGLDLWEQPRKL